MTNKIEQCLHFLNKNNISLDEVNEFLNSNMSNLTPKEINERLDMLLKPNENDTKENRKSFDEVVREIESILSTISPSD